MGVVFWYNVSPRAGQDENSVPQRAVFRYEWRYPAVQPELKDHDKEATVEVGRKCGLSQLMVEVQHSGRRG